MIEELMLKSPRLRLSLVKAFIGQISRLSIIMAGFQSVLILQLIVKYRVNCCHYSTYIYILHFTNYTVTETNLRQNTIVLQFGKSQNFRGFEESSGKYHSMVLLDQIPTIQREEETGNDPKISHPSFWCQVIGGVLDNQELYTDLILSVFVIWFRNSREGFVSTCWDIPPPTTSSDLHCARGE